MKKSRTTIVALLIVGLQLLGQPALAQTLTAQQLLQGLSSSQASEGFTGKRRFRVYRQNAEPLIATTDIVYTDRNHYSILLTGPDALKGILIQKQAGVTSAEFPAEQILLSDFSLQMPESFLLSLFSNRFDLLERNYETRALKDELINGRPAYMIEFIPKHRTLAQDNKYPLAQTPRRRYGLDPKTFQVLSEKRYWDSINSDGSWQFSSPPFYESWYESYTPGASAAPVVKPQTRQVKLSGQAPNTRVSYQTVAEAEAGEGIKIQKPLYLPKGFALKDIQVYRLYDARIQVQNYTDGLNDLIITLLPSEQAFKALLPQDFNQNLFKKIMDLSSQVPNNYYTLQGKDQNAIIFGDIMPIELQRVALTLNIPAGPPGNFFDNY